MIVRFNKEDRSTFPYWFAHWCSFQMVALNLKQWKFKYLFHDWYKPWMKLFCKYQTVQLFHNKYSNHHLLHYIITGNDADWEQMIIDWECSQYTKQQSPLNARQETERIISTLLSLDDNNKTIKQLKHLKILPFKTDEDELIFKLKVNYALDRLTGVLDKFGL